MVYPKIQQFARVFALEYLHQDMKKIKNKAYVTKSSVVNCLLL